jgi:NAD(P)-dependent dehydrogenase (short-subunit alcohol dehydrogenase family)|tara:strand:- start:4052 stop:5014 length:963 start_codon:yes stop_codon:yes gene_type:complete
MESFGGKLAVITGGGTGMGRALARQLVAEGCDVAMCDVLEQNMRETLSLCQTDAPQGVKISTHVCDVSDEEQVLRFKSEVEEQHARGYINLLFNNAGIGGGGSFIHDERADWERTYAVCWNGVYYNARAFMPLLLAADEGHMVNTSSVNGFWACLGNQTPHTAYSAAKFAVKGFSEALIIDLKLNAPHVKVSVVMPGHIGTEIAINTGRILGKPDPLDMPDSAIDSMRLRLSRRGTEIEGMTNDEIRQAVKQMGEDFRDSATTTSEEAAAIILDGVRKEKWRILIGPDAAALDRVVRADPELTYDDSFPDRLAADRETHG